MDFIGVLLLLALLYGLPEILRKKRKKSYEYPSVPESQSPPVPDQIMMQGSNDKKDVLLSEKKPQSLDGKESGFSSQTTTEPSVAAIASSSEGSSITSEQLRAAIVWSEILGKPKQIRPYGQKNFR
ncbi:MAG: hypothetical protein E6713_15425 [Sporomusaceae bacterium]|nr:hypothetical protein [Sporomusaceae bacterium]